MALEFIVSCEIEPWKETRIRIPEGSTHYKLGSGKVSFFRVNPRPSKSMREIPVSSVSIVFYMEKNAFNIEYGVPRFYDSQGNILKVGNNV
jgi:hypothetical protein